MLSLVTLKGKDLRALFEYVASNGGLPVSAGVRLVIKDKKVKSVTVGGEEIDDARTYTVATINYLVNLGRYGLQNAITRKDAPDIIRDNFVEYFRYLAAQNNNIITASKDGRIVVE